jgi:hypothetical protein
MGWTCLVITIRKCVGCYSQAISIPGWSACGHFVCHPILRFPSSESQPLPGTVSVFDRVVWKRQHDAPVYIHWEIYLHCDCTLAPRTCPCDAFGILTSPLSPALSVFSISISNNRELTLELLAAEASSAKRFITFLEFVSTTYTFVFVFFLS